MDRLLITGASGFLGGHCLKQLEHSGFEIHAISRECRIAHFARLNWHRIDLQEQSDVRRLMQEVKPTHLLHLAWCCDRKGYWTSDENDHLATASVELCRQFVELQGRRIVCAGTGAEYKKDDDKPHLEDESLVGASVQYTGAKIALHTELQKRCALSNISLIWARIFFAYGPAERPHRVIPSVIRSLLRGEPVACSEGLQLRDFVFAEDVAQCLISLLKNGRAGTYNVGSGTATSLKEVLSKIGDIIGSRHLIDFGALSSPAWEPDVLVADVSKLKNELQWLPDTPLTDGLSKTIEYWQKQVETACK